MRWILLVGGLIFAAPAWAEEPPLIWGSDAEGGVPYIFPNPENEDEYLGYEVEIVRALERELGRKIEFKQCLFDNLVPGLERGDFDFAMNGLEITEDRKARVRFSRPYYIYRQQLVARAGETRFDSLESCLKAGCVVGTLGETAADRLLTAMGFPDSQKRIYNDTTSPYRDCQLKRIDAVLLDTPIALYNARPDNPPKYATTVPGLQYVGKPLGEGYYAIAFRPQDEALAQQVDDALGRMMVSGELRKIYDKWQMWNGDQERLATATVENAPDASGGRGAWTIERYLPRLLRAAWMTVRLSFTSFALAIVLGLVIASVRLYGPVLLQAAAIAYIEFFRGIPVLFLLFAMYYTLPAVGGPKLDAFWVAVLGLGMSYAAYEAEIYRAGIQGVPASQWEAAASLGMPGTLIFRRIVMPQAFRAILPPATGDFVALFKDTSVVTVIALPDLMFEYSTIAKSSQLYVEVGLVAGVLYLMMSVPLGYLSRYLEQRRDHDVA